MYKATDKKWHFR